MFEPVGATAYLGAAPYLANNATLLSAAAGIYGVEVGCASWSLHACMQPLSSMHAYIKAQRALCLPCHSQPLMLQAYHAGIIDTLLYQNANTELPYNVTVAEFIELIADLENKVDGVADSQGIVTMSNGQEVANLVRCHAAATACSSSAAHVLPYMHDCHNSCIGPMHAKAAADQPCCAGARGQQRHAVRTHACPGAEHRHPGRLQRPGRLLPPGPQWLLRPLLQQLEGAVSNWQGLCRLEFVERAGLATPVCGTEQMSLSEEQVCNPLSVWSHTRAGHQCTHRREYLGHLCLAIFCCRFSQQMAVE